jgi:TonB family protein
VVARPGPEPLPPGRPDATAHTPGNISLDVSDFPFTYYLRQLQAKIGERWVPPRNATAGGERAIVVFEIGRDGQIKEPAVEKTSGNAIYDQSALRAVMEASPFPPLPPEFRAPSLRVHFGFEFRPEQG